MLWIWFKKAKGKYIIFKSDDFFENKKVLNRYHFELKNNYDFILTNVLLQRRGKIVRKIPTYNYFHLLKIGIMPPQ